MPRIYIYPEFELEVDVTVHSLGSPARLSGPPELCDPGDPPEIEWTITDAEIIAAFRKWEAEHAESIELEAIEKVILYDRY